MKCGYFSCDRRSRETNWEWRTIKTWPLTGERLVFSRLTTALDGRVSKVSLLLVVSLFSRGVDKDITDDDM
jgi:hypothetical protein